jgi:hypothetical protein
MTTYHLKGRATEHGSTIEYSRSHRSVEEALREAEKISASGQIVWIVDDGGNLVLPADQVRLRLRERNSTLQSS